MMSKLTLQNSSLAIFKRKLQTARRVGPYGIYWEFGIKLSSFFTQYIRKPFFGHIGAGSWLKKPDQILGPKEIFIGSSVCIERGAVLYAISNYGDEKYSGSIRIGDGVYANRYFNVTSAFGVRIGDRTAFGTNVFVNDFDHSFEDPDGDSILSPLVSRGKIDIGSRCWIGSNSYIGSGVTLGERCIVAANSVVLSSFPAFSMIAGAPAKLLKAYDRETGLWIRMN